MDHMVWVEIMLSKKKTFYCNFILLEFFLQKWNLSISCQLDLFRIQSLYYRNVSIHSLSVVFAYLFWYAWGNCGHPTNYVRNCLSDGICFILFRKKNSRMWDPVSQHYGSKHHQDKTIPPNHRQIVPQYPVLLWWQKSSRLYGHGSTAAPKLF